MLAKASSQTHPWWMNKTFRQQAGSYSSQASRSTLGNASRDLGALSVLLHRDGDLLGLDRRIERDVILVAYQQLEDVLPWR